MTQQFYSHSVAKQRYDLRLLSKDTWLGRWIRTLEQAEIDNELISKIRYLAANLLRIFWHVFISTLGRLLDILQPLHSKKLEKVQASRHPTQHPLQSLYGYHTGTLHPGFKAQFFNMSEEFTRIELSVVEGQIPHHLTGQLFYMAGGIIRRGSEVVPHYFGAHGMVIGIKFEEGIAKLSNRFIRDWEFINLMKHNKIHASGVRIAAEEDIAFFERLRGILQRPFTPMTTVHNIIVTRWGSSFLAHGEISEATNIDYDTLNTLTKSHYFCDGLDAVLALSSVHVNEDIDGKIYGLMGLFHGDKYIFSYDPQTNQRTAISKIHRDYNFYVHSFFITQNYIVVVLPPMFIGSFFRVLWDSIFSAFEYRPQMGTHIYILEKASGRMVKAMHVTNEGSDFFHCVGAYEQGEQITLYRNRSGAAYPYEGFLLHNLTQSVPDFAPIYLERMTISLHHKKTSVTLQQVRDDFFEFPRINPRFVGRRFRYAYGLSSQTRRYYDKLIHIDLDSGEILHAWYDPEMIPYDPCVIANPQKGEREQDVLILMLAYHMSEHKSYLLIFDENLSLLTKADIGIAVPKCIHSTYYERPDLNSTIHKQSQPY